MKGQARVNDQHLYQILCFLISPEFAAKLLDFCASVSKQLQGFLQCFQVDKKLVNYPRSASV